MKNVGTVVVFLDFLYVVILFNYWKSKLLFHKIEVNKQTNIKWQSRKALESHCYPGNAKRYVAFPDALASYNAWSASFSKSLMFIVLSG